MQELEQQGKGEEGPGTWLWLWVWAGCWAQSPQAPSLLLGKGNTDPIWGLHLKVSSYPTSSIPFPIPPSTNTSIPLPDPPTSTALCTSTTSIPWPIPPTQPTHHQHHSQCFLQDLTHTSLTLGPPRVLSHLSQILEEEHLAEKVPGGSGFYKTHLGHP